MGRSVQFGATLLIAFSCIWPCRSLSLSKAGGWSHDSLVVIYLGECILRTAKITALVLFLAFISEYAVGKDQIAWMHDMDAALAAAKKEKKPLMVDFVAEWCAPCKQMEKTTFNNSAVILKAKAFIPIRIDVDKQQNVASKYKGLPRAYGGMGIPNILFLAGTGSELKRIVGLCTAKEMLAAMDAVLKLPPK
jgi:thiol:disulfide interchange protein DsbD